MTAHIKIWQDINPHMLTSQLLLPCIEDIYTYYKYIYINICEEQK